MNLPKWQCYKVVEAAKITTIPEIKAGDTTVALALDCGVTVEVPLSYIHKHLPYEGGYFVLYPDGYQSFSPDDSFESGYTRLNGRPT